MKAELEPVREQVQHNCDVADARHGGDFTMCTYLLKMREYFRWEQGAGFRDPLPSAALGEWLQAREALWASLAEADYRPIEIGGRCYDPFDVRGINEALAPLGAVYSAGFVSGSGAHFFLAELLRREGEDACTLHLCGREYARCLDAPPAMVGEGGVFLRREALRRYLWEKYETWAWKRPDNALGRAFAHHGFDGDPEAALERMTDVELAAAREHELGEFEAGRALGEAWNCMVSDLALTPAELMARAVRDHLADALRTLPFLLDRGASASIHFYVGNLNGMRRHLHPRLQAAYAEWRDSGDLSALRALAAEGRRFWGRLAHELLALHARYGAEAAGPIREHVERRCLGAAR